MIRKLLLGLAILCTALTLTACNTVEGAGKDVSAVGQGVQDGAQTVQKKM